MISLNSYPPEWKINIPGEGEEVELHQVSSKNASVIKTLTEAMGGEIELELENPTSSSRYHLVVEGPLFTDSQKIAKRFVRAIKDDHPLARVGFQRFI